MFTSTHLGRHFLNGPFTSNSQLMGTSGVYVITTLNERGQHVVIDAGESGDIRARVSSHDRTQQWRDNANNGIFFAWTHYCNEATRMALESAIRLAYSPVCGVR